MTVRSFLRYWRPVIACLILIAVGMMAWKYIAESLRWETYTSSTAPLFSIKYLKGSVVVEDFLNPLLPLEKQAHGVVFKIPEQMLGANGITGGQLIVEYLETPVCDAYAFMPNATTTRTSVENGVTYSIAVHRYGEPSQQSLERVYAIVGSSPCIGIDYFLSTNNRVGFDPNAPATAAQPSAEARKFNYAKALELFDTMRRSLKLK